MIEFNSSIRHKLIPMLLPTKSADISFFLTFRSEKCPNPLTNNLAAPSKLLP